MGRVEVAGGVHTPFHVGAVGGMFTRVAAGVVLGMVRFSIIIILLIIMIKVEFV